jgi:hypothetical protein
MPMKMCLMLDELHPGLPGFDARYRFSCYLNNEKIESYTCTLSCAHPEVKFYAGVPQINRYPGHLYAGPLCPLFV